jgi:hypothetical protein
MRCRVDVLLRPEGEVTIERSAPRLYAAIDLVADALAVGVEQPARPSVA